MLHPLLGFSFGAFPIYRIMLCIAFFVGLFTLNKSMNRIEPSKFIRRRIRRSFFVGTCLGLAGANIANWFLFDNGLNYSLYQRITQSGYTFYFGMLCFFGVSALALRLYKINVQYCLNMVVPSVLIAHFWGRIGCSLAGCCYGREISLGGLSFYFPARELEAVFLLVMFFVIRKVIFIKRFRTYMFAYSLFRFVMEFFRGDARGSILGITCLSPTQIATLIVLVLIGIHFVLGLLPCKNKKEEPSSRKKTKYEPRSFSYEEPAGTKHPWKIVVGAVLGVVALCFAVIYFNPLNMNWLHNVRYSMTDVFAFIHNGKGTEEQIGDTNGIALVDVSHMGVVTDANGALELAKTYDDWKGFEFSVGEQTALPNGEQVYVLNQTVQGKMVLGKSRVLVTDKDSNALYMVGDAASFTYTNEVIDSYVGNMPTVAEAFGSQVSVIQSTDCWYDIGEGLVDAYHAILSDDGSTPVLGAVIQRNNEQIICYTMPQSGELSTFESNSIQLATESVLELLEAKDEKGIKELSKNKEEASVLEEDFQRMEKALCLTYEKSNLSFEQFASILESAKTIAEHVPNLNPDLYREIVKEETKQTILHENGNVKKADKYASKVEKAFQKCGIKQTEDEVTTTISAKERENTFRYAMNYATDKDVLHVIREEDKGVEITVQTENPITMDVYGMDGNFIDSLYIEKEESISLYPEEGDGYVTRVSNPQDIVGSVMGNSDYKVSVKSIDLEETVPDYIQNMLRRVADSYNRSNITTFASACALEGEKTSLEETLALGVLAPMLDSCANCVGVGDGLDTAKSVMAEMLIPIRADYDNLSGPGSTFYGAEEALEGYEFLKGSRMELSSFRYIETENGTYVKARMIIKMRGMELYNGFTFLQINYIEEDQLPLTEEEQAVNQALSFLANGSNYYITDMNSEGLYTAFGDTADNISATSDLMSLYDIWTSSTIEEGGVRIVVKDFDEAEALAKGHSQEKVDGFREYTARHNLMAVKQRLAELEAQRATYLAIAQADDIKTVISVVTDPFGTLADEVMSKNEVTDKIWTGAKFLTNPVETMTDAVVDEFLEELCTDATAEAQRLEESINRLNQMVDTYYQQLNALGCIYIENRKKKNIYLC